MKGHSKCCDLDKAFVQHAKNSIRTEENIQKISSDQGDDYTAGCLPDYFYFK